MASKKKNDSKDDKKGYQPKATARHAKITRSKEEEIEILRKKIDTDKYLAKKYEANRKTEIKSLPKEDRSAAKAELRESIAKRKEAEKKDKEKLRMMMQEERYEKGSIGKESFDDDEWIKGGRKKKKEREAAPAPAPEPAPAEASVPEPASAPAASEPDEVPEAPGPEGAEEPKKEA